MSGSKNEWKLPDNLDAMLKEYEMKFQYMLMMSTRIYQMIAAHLIFTGACLAALREGKNLIWAIVLLNIVVSSFLNFWIKQSQLRSRNRGERLREIAAELRIQGYGEDKTGKVETLKSISVRARAWVGFVALFWIVLAISHLIATL